MFQPTGTLRTQQLQAIAALSSREVTSTDQQVLQDPSAIPLVLCMAKAGFRKLDATAFNTLISTLSMSSEHRQNIQDGIKSIANLNKLTGSKALPPFHEYVTLLALMVDVKLNATERSALYVNLLLSPKETPLKQVISLFEHQKQHMRESKQTISSFKYGLALSLQHSKESKDDLKIARSVLSAIYAEKAPELTDLMTAPQETSLSRPKAS